MHTILCDRCGTKLSGKNELLAEVKFGNHACANKKNMDDMPFDLLRAVAFGDMTEEDAWKEAGKRS